MEDIKKQRICKKFNSDLEKPTYEIYEMLQKTFFDDSVCKTETFKW